MGLVLIAVSLLCLLVDALFVLGVPLITGVTVVVVAASMVYLLKDLLKDLSKCAMRKVWQILKGCTSGLARLLGPFWSFILLIIFGVVVSVVIESMINSPYFRIVLTTAFIGALQIATVVWVDK